MMKNNQDLQGSNISVFVGIYNGSKYLESIKKQLLEQTAYDFPILVVDNFSTDDSWEKLQSWSKTFGSRISLIRNDSNLGAGGSLKKAIDAGLISTKWFTAFHQDDLYLPNHIAVLTEAIENSEKNVVGICTSMGSIDNNGNRVSTPPRASWLVSNESQVDSFLINLRTQTLSWPSTAFRTEEFSRCFNYVHSPSFSDTEATLRLCAYGEFRYLRKETMRYRENPQSESHVVNSLESTVGAALGIVRVIASDEFRKICGMVSEKQEEFFLELMTSIGVRLGESILCEFVRILAIEECARTWNFKGIESSKSLAKVYSTLRSEFTSTLISSQIGIENPEPDAKLEQRLKELVGISSINLLTETPSRSNSHRLARTISRLPLGMKIPLFKVFVRVRAVKNPNHYWNAYWR